MIIRKVVNNNVVYVEDRNHNEFVLFGKGIGFKQKPGALVDESKIEKKFRMEDSVERNRIAELLSRISDEDFALADAIIQYAKANLKEDLNDNIYITLTDHIVFAMERVSQGISFTNQMLWEIKHFYPEEFAIGKHALEIIRERKGIEMPEDEAGFIAFHIANAHMDDDLPLVETMTKIIKSAAHIVSLAYNITLDEDSLDYGRFVTHLKFSIERAFSDKMLDEESPLFIQMIKEEYKEAYDVASRIAKLIQSSYGLALTESELVYLTVHIKRVFYCCFEMTITTKYLP